MKYVIPVGVCSGLIEFQPVRVSCVSTNSHSKHGGGHVLAQVLPLVSRRCGSVNRREVERKWTEG